MVIICFTERKVILAAKVFHLSFEPEVAEPVELGEALIILQCTKWFEALFVKHVDYFLVPTVQMFQALGIPLLVFYFHTL